MQVPPKIGTTFEKRFQVEPKYTVDFSADGIPPILATPWLIWFLEYAALDLLKAYLDEGEMTVGAHVDVEHLAPTPAGAEVICVARVVHSEGPVVSFQLDAKDNQGPIARGLHKRRIVNAGRFAEAVRRKLG